MYIHKNNFQNHLLFYIRILCSSNFGKLRCIDFSLEALLKVENICLQTFSAISGTPYFEYPQSPRDSAGSLGCRKRYCLVRIARRSLFRSTLCDKYTLYWSTVIESYQKISLSIDHMGIIVWLRYTTFYGGTPIQ